VDGGGADGAFRSELFRNLAFGLSVWSWAVLGIVWAEPAARVSVVRITVAGLNACVGTLFMLRAPLQRGPSAGAILASVPSMLLGGVAIALAPPPNLWPLGAQVLFGSGGLVAAIALTYLGRCFALLPAVRGVVARGPFRVVRHPTYVGELAMILAAGLARGFLAALAAGALGLSLVAARILAEERLLGELETYRRYMERVRWRLVPGLW